ncbi:hypothetical protein [Neolewinella antarctica]|uniref:Uncharacterized protein n=1 Tax=Neolewinella antarctica TaxID=442734 RepID=A0ABX0XAC2_9BACT|nr:hypothetical protein [Neolewinella antarctica]NJC25742.1 hypothetical protein [Neolewinella antarctica]
MPSTDRITAPYASKAFFTLVTAVLLLLVTAVFSLLGFGPNVGRIVILVGLPAVIMLPIGVTLLVISYVRRESSNTYKLGATVLCGLLLLMLGVGLFSVL